MTECHYKTGAMAFARAQPLLGSDAAGPPRVPKRAGLGSRHGTGQTAPVRLAASLLGRPVGYRVSIAALAPRRQPWRPPANTITGGTSPARVMCSRSWNDILPRDDVLLMAIVICRRRDDFDVGIFSRDLLSAAH